MTSTAFNECMMHLRDEDIVEAMKKISGYLDITPSDFMEIYQVAFHHALTRLRSSVRAEDIMTRRVIYVQESSPVTDAIRKMAAHDISGIPVIEENQRISGVISEKDVLRLINGGNTASLMGMVLNYVETGGSVIKDLGTLSAADIMTSPPVTVKSGATLSQIADIMDRFHINRVFVVDEGFRLSGVVARSDLVKTFC